MIAAVLVVALLGGAASCSGDDSGDLPPPASPPGTTDETPGLDLSPAEQTAVDEARAKFDEFMNAYVEVSTADLPVAEEAETLFARVEREAAGLLPQELRTEIVGRWGDNQIMEGAITWELTSVLDVDLSREVEGALFPRIGLSYCIDRTDWLPIDADTGDAVGEPGQRHLWAIAADWSEDWSGLGQGPEGWRIAERSELGDQPC